MMFLSQNLYNCNIPLTNELKLYAKDFFPEKFLYRKFDFVLLCSFSYILFGTYKSQSDLSVSLPRDMTETGEQVESVLEDLI